MEILINNCPIDFELEHEENVPDIVNSIYDWAGKRGLIFTDVFVNEKLYMVNNISDSDINDVEIINCIIESRAHLVFSSLDEGAIYCKKVVDFIEKSVKDERVDLDQVQNLASGITWLVEVLKKVITLIEIDVNSFKFRDEGVSDFTKRLEIAGEKIKNTDDEKKLISTLNDNLKLFMELKELFRMILLSREMKNLINVSIDSPDVLMNSLHDIKGSLPDVLKNIEEAAISFQTGKDKSGIDKLNEFIDFMLGYTRTCYQISPLFEIDLSELAIDGLSLEDKNNNIIEMLNETIDAMENNDIISLADILEYEIMPLFQNVDQYIDLLISRIDTN